MHVARPRGVDLDAGEVGDALDVVEREGHGRDGRERRGAGGDADDGAEVAGVRNGGKPRQISAGADAQ